MTRNSDSPSWHTFWDGSPEPIRVTEAPLRHILHGHPELLGEELAEEFRRTCQNPRADPAILAKVADKLKPPKSHAPNQSHGLLPLEYWQTDVNHALLHTTRELLLPNADVLVLRLAGEVFDLQTAFRPWASNDSPGQRWRRTRRTLVERYTVSVSADDRLLPFVLPAAGERFESFSPRGYRTDVRFIMPEKWGFRPIKIDDEILWVWQPPPWAASLVVPKDVLKRGKPSAK